MFEPSADIDFVQVAIETALRWHRDNPPVPSEEQVKALMRVGSLSSQGAEVSYALAFDIAVVWGRRMFDDLLDWLPIGSVKQ